ncbi:MAG: putative porin [Muribaculaceae bacterium]|nr:putative porin [Muribaculaceae bacterium]
MKRLLLIIFSGLLGVATATAQQTQSAKAPEITQKITSWRILPPLGERQEAEVDTMFLNYGQRSVPSAQSIAYATTGNLGGAGYNLIYFERPRTSDFFFRDALRAWLPSIDTQRFYNSRIPMTLVSYNFGGGKESNQDRLKADFSGNINAKAQVGGMVDYLYSKGSYNYQATKHLSWGLSGSYIGDRFEFQGFVQHYNAVNKENGGITDDRYITDPAEIQGGSTSVDYKTIPTRLSNAHNRVAGTQVYLNSRYKIGFYRDVLDGDSVIQEYVPVSSFIWTFDFKNSRHTFRNQNASQAREFWDNTYLNPYETNDKSRYSSVRNTFGVSLLEGFNKYAKAGLAVFLTHEYRHYTQPEDTVNRRIPLPETLTPLPFADIPAKQGENYVWIGAQLARRQGHILNYDATGRIGVIGKATGEVELNGNIYTHIPLWSDTLNVTAYGDFSNTTVPYLLRHYISNHFAWDNDFGKTRRLRFGGRINLPRTSTTLSAGVENVQNLVYFNEKALPTQCGSSVQVFSASLEQNFEVGILNWQNRLTYQTSSNDAVIPLPKFAVYSNLFITFKVAHVLDVQFGVDCDYFTKYKSVAYQPATMAFYNQREADCGNYPFVNAYLNFKLSKTRFYIMFSHVNQGLFGGDNWFSMPGYPLNPRRFQLGLSIDFAN